MAHVSRSGSAGRSSPCGFSVERLSKRNQVMQCKDFRGHSSVIRGLEFSDDGSLLVSGGDRTVLIWKMDQVLDRNRRQPVFPTVLKVAPKDFTLFSLAISPDNSRILVGGRDQAVYVYDAQT